MAFAALSLHSACLADLFELTLKAGNSLLHPPPVYFQLRFTRTARPDAARLSRQVMPHASQSRQKILQLSQLDLQTAFAAARSLREYVQNELGSIQDFAGQQIFQIASLSGRKFVIENH